MLKKLPGVVQISGLVGIILLPFLFLLALANETGYAQFFLLELLFLLLPALACKLLFEGDDSRIGKVLYGLGDFIFNLLRIRLLVGLIDKVVFWNRVVNGLSGKDQKRDEDAKSLEKMQQMIDYNKS